MGNLGTPKSTVKNCYMCYLLFIILCFRAGRPRPYLDNRELFVKVGARFPRPASSFPGGVKKTGGGFRERDTD